MNDLRSAATEIRNHILSSLDSPDSFLPGLSDERLVRIEKEIGYVNCLEWLRNQTSRIKIYWQDREHSLETAGIGEADTVTCASNSAIDHDVILNRIKKYLPAENNTIKYYGGIRFSNFKPGDNTWDSFGAYRFYVPRFEVTHRNGKSYLACNILAKRDQESEVQLRNVIRELDNIVFTIEPHPSNNLAAIKRTDLPDNPEWNRTIDTALKKISNNEFGKIVMARRSTIEFSAAPNPVDLLMRLKKINPDSFHFYFQPEPGKTFIGGSPERLYRRDELQILSEAIAGTRIRGETQDKDKLLEEDLLTCDKDLREHQFVHQSVKEGLEKLCRAIEASDKVTVIKLARIQHLYSRFQGTLSHDVTDADILNVLHPTPAVGGYPADKAIENLYELETFDRGWYAGPVGWISKNQAEFAVAIRSGLVSGNNLLLFSGAGIVTGSKPQEEWEEIENKIINFIKILNGK